MVVRLGELYVTARERVNNRDASRYMILSTVMDVELSLHRVDFSGLSMLRAMLASLLLTPILASAVTTVDYRSSVVLYNVDSDQTRYMNCQVGIYSAPHRYVVDCGDSYEFVLIVDRHRTATIFNAGIEKKFPLTALKSDENWLRFSFGSYTIKFYPPQEY